MTSKELTEGAETRSRFIVSKRGNLTRKYLDGKPGLSKRDHLLIRMVCYGIDAPWRGWPEVPVGEPLDPQLAGDMLRMRRKYVRALLADIHFQASLRDEVTALRTGAKAGAIRKLINLVDEPLANDAASRMVQLLAARQILGATLAVNPRELE